MDDNQDLEGIVKQLQNSPGHILGLNGWLLRTLPKDKRTTFLRGFEKLVRVAYFPDHASNAKAKSTRESYIQSVASAVSYLTGDEFAFDLAVEEVPTERNPVVKLKIEMEQMKRDHQENATSLSKRLDSASEEIKNQNKINQDLQRANALEIERVSVLTRLQEHNRRYLLQNRVYEIKKRGSFSISGHFIDFDRERGMDLLHAIVLKNAPRFDTAYANFQEVLEAHFLSNQKETLKFRNGATRREDYILQIKGGLTIGSIKEFLTYINIFKRLNQEISRAEFRKNLCDMPNTTLSFPREYCKDSIGLVHFSIPVFNIGMPILIRETLRTQREYLPKEKRGLPREKNSLFYVTGVNPYS